MIDKDAIRQRWDAVGSKLDERGQRLFAAVEVRAAGWGGLAAVSKITGLARSTINRGKADLDAEPLPVRSNNLWVEMTGCLSPVRFCGKFRWIFEQGNGLA